MEIKKNDIYTINILDIGTNGEGIGKIDDFTVFVPNALPNDIIEVKIIKLKKSYGYGKLIKIITPSPLRTEPKCEYFYKCGGCSLQHLDYDAQLNYKTKKVKDCLERIGGFNPINISKAIGMNYPYNYRNKAQFPIGLKNNETYIGFYSMHSHNIINIDDCIIQHPINKLILSKIRSFISKNNIKPYDETNNTGLIRHIITRISYATKEIMICIVLNCKSFDKSDELIKYLTEIKNISSIYINYNTEKTNVILGKNSNLIYGKSYITDYIDNLKFEISLNSFFQVNPYQTKILYNKALDMASLTGNETVIDAYCGIGTISLFAAKKAKQVYGIEIIENAINDAIRNAEINNINNVKFIVGKAEDEIYNLYKDNDIKADLIIIDPPRKGCDIKFLETLLIMKPEKIVYISCDPATLARDLKILCNKIYNLNLVQPVDLFCMTNHIETCCLLTKK